MAEQLLSKMKDLLEEKYELSSVDAGEYKTFKANGMKFSLSAYKAEGLGHVSIMSAIGFFGLMKMDTLIIAPIDKDLPLYSYDRIYAMGNDTLITELYDTCEARSEYPSLSNIKSEYGDIPERDPGEHWYDDIKLPESISKKSKKDMAERMDAFAYRHFGEYLSCDAPKCAKEEKTERTRRYSEGLLSKGGPSTDVFIKSLGREKTEYIFRHILFGTE